MTIGFAYPAETEATCIWKISLQIVVEISKSLCQVSLVPRPFCYAHAQEGKEAHAQEGKEVWEQ